MRLAEIHARLAGGCSDGVPAYPPGVALEFVDACLGSRIGIVRLEALFPVPQGRRVVAWACSWGSMVPGRGPDAGEARWMEFVRRSTEAAREQVRQMPPDYRARFLALEWGRDPRFTEVRPGLWRSSEGFEVEVLPNGRAISYGEGRVDQVLHTVVYRDGTREMRFALDREAGVLHALDGRGWEAPHGHEPVSHAERSAILGRLYQAFHWKGHAVSLA